MSGPEQKKKSFSLLARGIISAVMLLIAFNLAYGTFFRDNPLYGVKFLAEALIALVAASVGFFLVPIAFLQIQSWVENVINVAVSNIVGDFWDQQSSRMEKRKREKQQQRAEEEKKKLQEQLQNGVLLDTSVLVDGRILDIVKCGFFDKVLVIPTAVMNELHLISDSANKTKRERGRRGLDIVRKLKNRAKIITPSINHETEGVDISLLEFAKQHRLKLMTQDYNLNKLAQAQGVKVLNINELVEAVKLSVIPGEMLEVQIQHEGKEKQQGIGYMPDGTMAVVENARTLIGKTISAKVLRVIQSKAGKIIFCEYTDNNNVK